LGTREVFRDVGKSP